MLTNSQPDDLDEAQEQVLNTNDLGTAASETVSTAAAPANQASAAANDDDDDEEEDEEEDDDENVLGDDDDEDEDEEEDDEARKASKCVLYIASLCRLSHNCCPKPCKSPWHYLWIKITHK